MPTNLLPAIGYILAAVLAGIALYYWRRSASLYALLVEGANRFEELRQRNGQLEQTLSKADEKRKQSREQTARLEKAVDDAREKSAELLKKLEQKDHETRLVAEKLELQKGHLEKQLAKFQAQLQQSETWRLDLETQLNQLRSDTENRLETQRQANDNARREATSREQALHLKLKELDKERAAFERKSKEGDPIELKRLRRKIAQYDRLYAGMKGLREMTDERNRNWEVALRKLSEWVIQETSTVPGASAPQDIGPLVGQALQAIGAQLIDDTEAHTLGASRTDAMADDQEQLPLGKDRADQEAEEYALKHGLSRKIDAST